MAVPEQHPLGFFLPAHARVLMLGSFPPDRKRWSMEFYYPNIQNDMWRIMGMIFFGDREYFLVSGKKAFDEPKVREFCREAGIAIGDTAEKIVRQRDNASDKFLEVVEPWSPGKVLSRIPECRALVVTGKKALETLLTVLPAHEPKVGGCTEFEFQERHFRLYRIPSTSRAYPKPLEEKAAIYRKMFEELGIAP